LRSYKIGPREIRDTMEAATVAMPGAEVETAAEEEEAYTVEQYKGRGLCQKVR